MFKVRTPNQSGLRPRLMLDSSGIMMAVFGLVIVSFTGCTPRVIVRKSPTDNDRGIRYYRPKPYLKIEPAEVLVAKNQTALTPGLVRISLVYMPDFSEEYSINVRTGCGIADVGIKLEDGWNLTEISQDLDSQTDENLEAVGSILSAAGGLIPTSASDKSVESISFTVPARNVPLGFYESVVGRDSCNVKRLYGFRYVGFMPFAGCPIEMSGHSHACCIDPSACGQHPAGSLYGLTFVGGEMVFQSLDLMSATPALSATRAIGEADSTSAKNRSPDGNTEVLPAPERSDAIEPSAVDLLGTQLRAYLTELGQPIVSFSTESKTLGSKGQESNGQRTKIKIVVPIDTPTLLIRTTVEDWLNERFGETRSFDLQIEAVQP